MTTFQNKNDQGIINFIELIFQSKLLSRHSTCIQYNLTCLPLSLPPSNHLLSLITHPLLPLLYVAAVVWHGDWLHQRGAAGDLLLVPFLFPPKFETLNFQIKAPISNAATTALMIVAPLSPS